MDSTNLDSELFIEFKSRGKRCQLLYISESHSEGLYEIVSTERERLAKWLPWVENMKSLENEKAFIKYVREKNGAQWVIYVNNLRQSETSRDDRYT